MKFCRTGDFDFPNWFLVGTPCLLARPQADNQSAGCCGQSQGQAHRKQSHHRNGGALLGWQADAWQCCHFILQVTPLSHTISLLPPYQPLVAPKLGPANLFRIKMLGFVVCFGLSLFCIPRNPLHLMKTGKLVTLLCSHLLYGNYRNSSSAVPPQQKICE
jgi:hypothetical protein